MLTDHVVLLGKSWVSSRRQMGKGQLVLCESRLQLNDAVRAEIGREPTIFTITVQQGQERKEMQAMRIGNDTVCWVA